MEHPSAAHNACDHTVSANKILGYLRTILTDANLMTIAESQDGPREPIIIELNEALQGAGNSPSFATLNAVSYTLYSNSVHRVPGSALMCYVLLLESAISNRGHPSSMQMHSALPHALSDAFSLGDVATSLLSRWLQDCLTCFPLKAHATDPLGIQSFIRLGVLFALIWQSTNMARDTERVIDNERSALDKVLSDLSNDHTDSIYDLDPYMSERKRWVSLWLRIATEYDYVVKRIHGNITGGGMHD